MGLAIGRHHLDGLPSLVRLKLPQRSIDLDDGSVRQSLPQYGLSREVRDCSFIFVVQILASK